MKAVRIMNDHYDEHLTLNSIAELLSVSPPYLSHIFSRNVGMTYASYLCQLRLHHAARLLTDSSKAITDICYACGYRNLSHFLRSFKEQYGMTLKEYRHFTTESFPSSNIPSEETSDHYGLVITLEV